MTLIWSSARSILAAAHARAVALAVLLAMLLLFLGAAAAVAPPSASAASAVTLGATESSERFLVHAREPDTAAEVLDLAHTAWDRLFPYFRHSPTARIVVIVVEDEGEYEDIAPAPMTRAFATYGGNQMYLRGQDVSLEILLHELTHILLGVNVRPGVDVPDWFNEGLAQYASGEEPPSLQLMFSYGSGEFLPLHELDDIDALHGPDRQLASLEGLAVVHFLADRYGKEKLWDFVDRLARARTFNQAFIDTYGLSDLEINEEWAAYAEDTYGFFSPSGLRMFGYVLIGFTALAAATIGMLRRMLRLRREEGPELTQEEILQAERAALLMREQERYNPPEDEGPVQPR